MNKNRIRLTESQLHRVIKQSVKKILKEEYDYKNRQFFFNGQYGNNLGVNSAEWKNMFDDGNFDASEGDYDSLTQKEISDYEAMPEKQRHPNWNGRIKDYGIDKLASKKPNNILDKMNKKKYGGPVGSLKHFEAWLNKESNETLNEFSRFPMTIKKMTIGRYAYVFKLNKKNVLNDILGYFDPLYDYDKDIDYANFYDAD